MIERAIEHITSGIAFVRENPRLLFALSLIVVIPVAFLVVSDRFLDVSIKNQERLERDRVALMQSVLISFIPELPSDLRRGAIGRAIASIAEGEEGIVAFKVLERVQGEFVVIASIVPSEVGMVDAERRTLYEAGNLDPLTSIIFVESERGVRHWRAVRTLPRGVFPDGGAIYTDFSMERFDALARQNVVSAYILLAVVVLSVFALLVRQARIIDYTALYRELKALDHMKDDFISMAAHELRTPVSVIRGYIDEIHPDGISARGAASLDRIKVSSEQLQLLIEDILDVSRIQSGKFSFEPVSAELSSAIPTMVSALRNLAEEKHLEFAVSASNVPAVRVDPDRLKQVIVNLVGNAVKYTNAGRVEVRVYAEKERVYVRVSDTGIGISAEDQRRLFEKFFRVRSDETKDIRGTGLGLWISGQIVRLMGGDIGIESIKGKGTDVVLSFPTGV